MADARSRSPWFTARFRRAAQYRNQSFGVVDLVAELAGPGIDRGDFRGGKALRHDQGDRQGPVQQELAARALRAWPALPR